MWSKIPWSIILRFGVPVLVTAFLIFKVITGLIGVGEDRVQKKWDAAERAHQAEVVLLKEIIEARQRQHRNTIDAINDDIAQSEKAYEARLAGLRGSHAIKLRRSEDRAEIYRNLSESGATQRANLASYAAQLDRSLVEGRQVVEELRATVVQRDQQLIGLGKQLQADRELINTPLEN